MEKILGLLVILAILLIEIGIGILIYNIRQWIIFPYGLLCLAIDIPLVEIFDGN